MSSNVSVIRTAVLLIGFCGGLCACGTDPAAEQDGAIPDDGTAADSVVIDSRLTQQDGAASDGLALDSAQVDSAIADASLADGPTALACGYACHGDKTNSAPPWDTALNTSTSARGVGAHREHLRSSSWHMTVACSDCHVVPQTIDAAGHVDKARPADLTFSSLATGGQLNPKFDGTACSNVYCHGATLSGGTATAPIWTKVDGTQGSCGSCHSLPPTQNHPASSSCSTCHGAVIDAKGMIIAPQLHINGKVEVSGGHAAGWIAGAAHGAAFNQQPSDCTGCHGSDLKGGSAISCEGCHAGWQTKCTHCHGGTDNQSGAPPEAVDGATAKTTPSVGQHSIHVMAGAKQRYGCELCHSKPKDALSAGHIDGTAKVVFSGMAQASGAAYDSSTFVCSNVYCHGAKSSGGTLTTPKWTRDDGTQAACGTCHGLPPTKNHTTSTSCSTCHGAVVDAQKKIIAPELHVNGKIEVTSQHPTGWAAGAVHGAAFNKKPSDCTACHGSDLKGGSASSCEKCHGGWQTNCTFCHGGTDNQTGAPPEAVDGTTATSDPRVGRHSVHVAAGGATRYDCDVCHAKPKDALTAGHIDGTAKVVFSGLAQGASYNPTTAVCSNVYCHGDGKGSGGTATWTGTLSGGCSACHDDETDRDKMKLSGKHKIHAYETALACSECHGCMVDSSKQITDPSRHIDGKAEFCGRSGYNTTTQTCTLGCHGWSHVSFPWF